jgi:hypothetical protein
VSPRFARVEDSRRRNMTVLLGNVECGAAAKSAVRPSGNRRLTS